jgi:hypothetical protein
VRAEEAPSRPACPRCCRVAPSSPAERRPAEIHRGPQRDRAHGGATWTGQALERLASVCLEAPLNPRNKPSPDSPLFWRRSAGPTARPYQASAEGPTGRVRTRSGLLAPTNTQRL